MLRCVVSTTLAGDDPRRPATVLRSPTPGSSTAPTGWCSRCCSVRGERSSSGADEPAQGLAVREAVTTPSGTTEVVHGVVR